MTAGYARELATLTWEELRDLGTEGAVAILPVGAVEAHGPHLPLDTDVIIAREMAREGAERLAADGHRALVLPALAWTPAPFAASFPGTISIRPETLEAVVGDIHGSLASQGVGTLALANAHLDPTHVATLRRVADVRPGIVFPDLTRRRWAERLTDEFRSGACHAGRYETSIVMAAAADVVREDARTELEPVLHSLSRAIREGKRTFEEVGGPRAYFGDPAAATAAEGRRTLALLGDILAEAVRARLSADGPEHGHPPAGGTVEA
jgi:creatinine amidohydrolase